MYYKFVPKVYEMKYYGAYAVVKTGKTSFTHDKYILLFTDRGIYGMFVGPLLDRPIKMKLMIKLIIMGMIFDAIFGQGFGIAAASSYITESIEQHINSAINVRDLEKLQVQLKSKKEISIPINRVKWVKIHMKEKKMVIKTGYFKKYKFIVREDNLDSITRILLNSGLKTSKIELEKCI